MSERGWPFDSKNLGASIYTYRTSVLTAYSWSVSMWRPWAVSRHYPASEAAALCPVWPLTFLLGGRVSLPSVYETEQSNQTLKRFWLHSISYAINVQIFLYGCYNLSHFIITIRVNQSCVCGMQTDSTSLKDIVLEINYKIYGVFCQFFDIYQIQTVQKYTNMNQSFWQYSQLVV